MSKNKQSMDSVQGRVLTVEQSSDFSASIHSSMEQSSDEIKQSILCDVCKRDGKQIEAEGFCIDCEEHLCRNCYNFHKKLPVLKNHVLQNKDTMPKTTKAKVKDKCKKKCSIHSDRILEYICQPCDQLGCNVCMTTKHNQLSCKVHHIPDIIDGLCVEQAEEYKELQGTLKGIAVKLDQNKAKYESNLQRKTHMKEQAKLAIKSHRENMNQMFDKFEKKIESEMTSMEEYNVDLLKSVLGRQESLTLDHQTITSDLEHKQNTGQRCELLIAMKKAKGEIETLQDEVVKLDITNHIVNYKFQASDDFADLMEKIKHSGKIQLIDTMVQKEEVERKEINIKSENDKVSCTVSGLCFLPDDRLVITDVRNEALKVIDVKEEVILSNQAMSSKPWDVTSLEQDNIAVTLPDEKKIRFVSIDKCSSMKQDEYIDVSGSCRGIDYRQGHLIVSFDKPDSKVQIIDTNGQVKSTFTRDSSGNQLFIKPWYLALSPDGYTIYVSDNSRYTITSLTLEGNVKAIYENQDLKKPVGLAVDSAGSVFVVGSSMYSSKIHQLDEHFSQVQILENFSHGITYPRSTLYSNKEQKLYVGMEFSEKLLVISMKKA